MALTARTEGLESGFKRADGAIARFEKSFAGKFVKGAGIIALLDQGLRVLADTLEQVNAGEKKFGEAFRENYIQMLYGIPVAGEVARSAVQLRDMWTGAAASLRDLNEELEAHRQKLESLNRTLNVTRDAQAKAADAARALAEAQAGDDSAARLQIDIDAITKKYDELIRRLGEVTRSYEEYRRAENALNQARADEIETAKQLVRNLEAETAAREAAKIAAEAQAKAAQVAGMLASMEEQIILLRDGAAALNEYRLAQLGATEADLERMRALQAQLDELTKQQELDARAKQVLESIMTPMQRYRRELERLQELLDSNRLTQEEFARAVAMARGELERMSEAQDKLRPAAIEQRFTAGFPGQGMRGKDNGMLELKPLVQKELQNSVQQTKFQSEMVRTLRDIRDGQPQLEEGTL